MTFDHTTPPKQDDAQDSTVGAEPVAGEATWKCAGCGAEAVGRTKPCDCPTDCGFRGRGPEMECTTFVDHAAEFARWVEQGPKLALAAGLYVGIKVYASEAAARKKGDIS